MTDRVRYPMTSACLHGEWSYCSVCRPGFSDAEWSSPSSGELLRRMVGTADTATTTGPTWTHEMGTAPTPYSMAYPEMAASDPAEPLPTWPRHDPATGFGLALIVGAVVVACLVACLVAWKWLR